MIHVNTKTLTATREPLPSNLQGLSVDTLRNLQTELNPVPSELQDIEFWDEVDTTPSYDATTHVLDGTEMLTCNAETKTVSVVRGIRAKTQEELDAERKALVPAQITPRQIRMQLTASGLRQSVEDYIHESTDYNLKDWWEYATSFDRNSTVLIDTAHALGLTDEQIDTMFIEASKL